MNQCISKLFRVRPAFLRSVNVAEDYDDPRSSDHYVVTNLVRETLQRISSGLLTASSQRAWRITGDYGTGKSSFALALARVAAKQHDRLPSDLQDWMDEQVKLEPILVTGDLESLRSSIIRGIKDTENRVFGTSKSEISAGCTNEEIILHLDQLGDRVRSKKIGDGLLLVLDELGQNLRYAAQHPDDDDIFLLQRLGEKAARSNGKPLMVLALLHQGFSSYAAAADAVAKREWDKVSGRFEEIVFSQPVEQTAIILAETLGINAKQLPLENQMQMRELMNQAVTFGLYGSLAAKEHLITLAPRLFPLNPIVLPVLVALLRKFGQNERSIVSFLTSFEPFGLRAFADKVSVDGGLYRISDLYDYFRSNLSQLGTGLSRARWDIAESVVDKGLGYGETEERILKCVAILNMVDDPALPSIREIIVESESLADNDTIEFLVSTLGLLHERGMAKGLSLWPHTSANLEELLRQAGEELGGTESQISSFLNYLPARQLVARRHYVETGNLRNFSVRYVHAKNAEEVLSRSAEQTSDDGIIIVIIPFSAEEHLSITQLTKNMTLSKHVIFGISNHVAGTSHTLSELRRWEWVRKNARELSFDQYAVDYVRDEIERLKASLHREVEFLTDFVVDHNHPIQWFYDGNEIQVDEHRGIAGFLSTVCDELYPQCPIVKNELINRRVTSAAASRARTLLIEAIATKSSEECLGFDKEKNPPELAIYLSVLLEGKLHVQEGETWRFISCSELNDDPCRLAPSLNRIHELLLNADLDSVEVNNIYAELRRPPYGVRDGLLPLIVAVYLAGHWQETSVYEDGTFLIKVGGDEFQRLNKEPEAFSLQHCSVSGVRLSVYEHLTRALGSEVCQRPDVLTVVRPLVTFAVSLTEYVRNAREVLSPGSRKVRDILLSTQQPITLLFKELPEALGLSAVMAETYTEKQINELVTGLTEVIAELRNAYPALLVRIRNGLQDAFGLQGDFGEFRTLLAARSSVIAEHIHDLDFKSFVLRLGDTALPDTQWVESIATLVAKRAPERWRNIDEVTFFENLSALVPRFLRVESMRFNNIAGEGDGLKRCVRLTVTRPDGSEAEETLHWKPEDDLNFKRAEATLKDLIRDYGNIALAAAAGLFWQQQCVEEDDD